QDSDLNRRLISSGGKIWQSPKITSWYLPRTRLRPLFQQYFQYGFWKVTVIRKHGKAVSWRNFIPAICLLVGIGVLLGTVVAKLNGSEWWQSVILTFSAALAGVYFLVSTG